MLIRVASNYEYLVKKPDQIVSKKSNEDCKKIPYRIHVLYNTMCISFNWVRIFWIFHLQFINISETLISELDLDIFQMNLDFIELYFFE